MQTIPQIQVAEYQISQDLQDFLAQLEESELTPEEQQQCMDEFFQRFLANEQELKDKISRACYYMARLEKETEYYEEQAERFLHLAKTTANRQQTLKNFIQQIVESKGGQLSTKDFPKLKTKFNAPAVNIDPNYPLKNIPEEFLKPPKSREVSKPAIAAALKAGMELPFAWLSQSKSLIGWK